MSKQPLKRIDLSYVKRFCGIDAHTFLIRHTEVVTERLLRQDFGDEATHCHDDQDAPLVFSRVLSVAKDVVGTPELRSKAQVCSSAFSFRAVR